VRFLLLLCLIPVLGGCSLESRQGAFASVETDAPSAAPARPQGPSVAAAGSVSPISRYSERNDRVAIVETGTGRFVEGQARRQIELDTAGAGVTLNFVDVEIQDFVRAVFDEIFKETVIIDSGLKGRVTVRTPGAVSATVAKDLVRQALQASGATLVQSGGVYRVATKSDQKGNKRLGETLRLIPLTYIGAEEAKAALMSMNSGVEITTGPSGQYLSISGSATDLDNLEEVIAVLDVDQMKGMSFGLFPLKEAGAAALSIELNQMFNKEGDARGFRALPIARMNSVLVLSPRPHLLTAARKWVARLDQANQDQRKIYVYPVQNRRAADVAKLLAVVMQSDKSAQQDVQTQSVSPALTPAPSGVRSRPADMMTTASTSAMTAPAAVTDYAANPAQDNKARGLRISSDLSTNSIVVTATPAEWRIIEAALRRLDVMPPQVLIEATIAEVTLNDALQYGVKWYFQKGPHGIGLTGDSFGAVAPNYPGFNYSFGIPQAQIVLSALSQITHVEVVSSPALTVLDNETAKLQVGDQVPIATRSSQSTITPDAPTVNDIELKDTGVILSVTPRVNASGLVVLDISQEVSDVVPTTTSNLNSPTIRQRRVNSSVGVTSGHEIVLGGLISLNRNRTDSGIPGLIEVPVVGELFKSQATKTGTRTELIVILRPTVMRNNLDIQNVTEEIKQRMSSLRAASARR
jgi:general secretion pathway protein D